MRLYIFRKLLLHPVSELVISILTLCGMKNDWIIDIFDAFDIEPVFLNKQNMAIDYFENKKLYFIKKVDGNSSMAY